MSDREQSEAPSEEAEKTTEMMLDALRLLVADRAVVVCRHATLEEREIPVRTASALVNRGWAARRLVDGKTTLLELTNDGQAAAFQHGLVVQRVAPGTDPKVPLTAAQIEHVHRAIRYLGEAMTALSWANLPMPAGSDMVPLHDLSRGERLVGEASNKLIDAISAYTERAGP